VLIVLGYIAVTTAAATPSVIVAVGVSVAGGMFVRWGVVAAAFYAVIAATTTATVRDVASPAPFTFGGARSTDSLSVPHHIPFGRRLSCVWFVGAGVLSGVGAFVVAADFLLTTSLRSRAPAATFDGRAEVNVVR
jgi:hypothetical protein